MRQTRVLESVAELSSEVVEPEPDRPAPASPEPSPAAERQPRETQLPIPAPEHSILPGYPHCGLNE